MLRAETTFLLIKQLMTEPLNLTSISPDLHAEGRKRITGKDYQQEGIVPFVVDAVYAMAHALTGLMQEQCEGLDPRKCTVPHPPDGKQLLHYIRNVSFTG